MYNGQYFEEGSQENWFRIKAESLGQCLWLDSGEEQRGREVGLVYQICWLCASGWSGRGVISMEQLSRAIEVDFF